MAKTPNFVTVIDHSCTFLGWRFCWATHEITLLFVWGGTNKFSNKFICDMPAETKQFAPTTRHMFFTLHASFRTLWKILLSLDIICWLCGVILDTVFMTFVEPIGTFLLTLHFEQCFACLVFWEELTNLRLCPTLFWVVWVALLSLLFAFSQTMINLVFPHGFLKTENAFACWLRHLPQNCMLPLFCFHRTMTDSCQPMFGPEWATVKIVVPHVSFWMHLSMNMSFVANGHSAA